MFMTLMFIRITYHISSVSKLMTFLKNIIRVHTEPLSEKSLIFYPPYPRNPFLEYQPTALHAGKNIGSKKSKKSAMLMTDKMGNCSINKISQIISLRCYCRHFLSLIFNILLYLIKNIYLIFNIFNTLIIFLISSRGQRCHYIFCRYSSA